MPSTFNDVDLLDRIGGDAEFLAEMVQMLDDDGHKLMTQLHTAIAASDVSAVTHHAHTLKGMVSNFSATAAQESALAIERMGRSGDIVNAAQTAGALEQQLNALIAELQEFVKQGSA
jgi:HPt (histidine-containing phosphotransfer) domain-containing protein